VYYRAPNPEDGVYIDYRISEGSAAGTIEIHDASGALLRTLPAPVPAEGAVVGRVVWDMRGQAAGGGRQGGRGGAGGGGRGGGRGALVEPGAYDARLVVGGRTYTTTVYVRADPGR
jgi:hypothetical protein